MRKVDTLPGVATDQPTERAKEDTFRLAVHASKYFRHEEAGLRTADHPSQKTWDGQPSVAHTFAAFPGISVEDSTIATLVRFKTWVVDSFTVVSRVLQA